MSDAQRAVEDPQPDGKEQRTLEHISEFDLLPADIAHMVGHNVIGQQPAVERMSVLLRAHVLRMQQAMRDGTISSPPGDHGETGCVLLIGPSGCGKTLLIRHMARIAGLPHVVEDCSSLSATGYVGRSVPDILVPLLARAEGRADLWHWGIVALDEFDKLRRRRHPDGDIDVGGEGVQRCLLGLMGGAPVEIDWPSSGGRGRRRWLPFDPGNLLIILAGVFEGLEEVVARRLGGGRRRIGFGAPDQEESRAGAPDPMSQLTPDDLVRYGFLPEIVGRIRQVIVMRRLTPSSLRRILMETSEGPLEVLQRAAKREGFEFSLADDLVDAIVREAISRGLGARSLHSILSRITARAMFEVPAKIGSMADVIHRVELGPDALRDGSYELVVARSREREAECGSASEARV